MTTRTTDPSRADTAARTDAVEAAGSVEAVAERTGLSPEVVRECRAGEREWPE